MKDKLNVGILCGGRTSGKTYAQFIAIYEKAKKEGYTDVCVHFFDPYLNNQQKIIDRLSRKIQRKNEKIKHYKKLANTYKRLLITFSECDSE